MVRGRPPKGLTHIDSLTPDPESRKRLKAVLATLMGQMTVAEACSRLSLSESCFHELRHRALAGMVDGLEPQPPGRPPNPVEETIMRSYRLCGLWMILIAFLLANDSR